MLRSLEIKPNFLSWMFACRRSTRFCQGAVIELGHVDGAGVPTSVAGQ